MKKWMKLFLLLGACMILAVGCQKSESEEETQEEKKAEALEIESEEKDEEEEVEESEEADEPDQEQRVHPPGSLQDRPDQPKPSGLRADV